MTEIMRTQRGRELRCLTVRKTIKSPLLTHKIASKSSLMRTDVPLFPDAYLDSWPLWGVTGRLLSSLTGQANIPALLKLFEGEMRRSPTETQWDHGPQESGGRRLPAFQSARQRVPAAVLV